MAAASLHQHLEAESKRWDAQQRTANPYFKHTVDDDCSTITSDMDLDDSMSLFSASLSRCSSATSVASDDFDDGLHILPQPMLAAPGQQGITIYASFEDAVAQSNATLALQRATHQELGVDSGMRRIVAPGKLYNNEEDDDEIEEDIDDDEAAMAGGFATG